MFKYFSITVLILFLALTQVHANPLPEKVLLHGKVIDQLTGQFFQGASIYFPELKKGAAKNDK